MKTIIMATDFSDVADNAANYAADMASAIGADLVLLHIYQIPVAYLEVPIATEQDGSREDAETKLDLLRHQLAMRAAGKLHIKSRFEVGAFFPTLDHICEEIKPYAVVMGSQGSTAAQRVFLGGHTVYAMKHLLWPLITVPPFARFSQIKKICLACDFKKIADSTPIDEVKTLVKDMRAELHVVQFNKDDSYHSDEAIETGLKLRELLAILNPHYHLITGQSTDESIIGFVENNDIDLLITLPKRRGLLNQLIHRSVSKRIILHSHIPVMSFQPSNQ